MSLKWMLLAENVDVAKGSRLSTSAKRIGKSKANPLWANNRQINNTRYVCTSQQCLGDTGHSGNYKNDTF